MSAQLTEQPWQVFSITRPSNSSNNSNLAPPETALERLAATGFPIPTVESAVLPRFLKYDPRTLWAWFIEVMELHRGNALGMWQLVTWKQESRPGVDLAATCDRCVIFGLDCTRSQAAYDAAADAKRRRRRGASHFDTMATYAEELGFIEPNAPEFLGIVRDNVRDPLEMRGVCCDNCLAARDKYSKRCSLCVRNPTPTESQVQILREELVSVGVVAAREGPLARYNPRCLTCLVEDVSLKNGADKDRRKGPNMCCAVDGDAKCYRCREMGRNCVWGREFFDLLDDSAFPGDPIAVDEPSLQVGMRAGPSRDDNNFVAPAATLAIRENLPSALQEPPRPNVTDNSQSHRKGNGHAGRTAIDTEAASSNADTAPSTAMIRAEDDSPHQNHLPDSIPSIMVVDTDEDDGDKQHEQHDAAGPSSMPHRI
ncbi:hypothetical protein MN608_03243 [Microdochium nivale]|nr:hypothetical protein MN608_03243 [Microdochium nivale]